MQYIPKPSYLYQNFDYKSLVFCHMHKQNTFKENRWAQRLTNEWFQCKCQITTVAVKKYKWRRCSKKKCCKQCGQVKFMGTMTKWPIQKHTEHHKTRSKQGRNRHKEITIFCVFRFFCFLFSIFNYLKDFSRKCWITALVRSMKIIGGLNQFSAAANLTLIQHLIIGEENEVTFSS